MNSSHAKQSNELVLDTNACIRFLNGRSQKLRDRLAATRPDDLRICSVVKAELFFGAALSKNPTHTIALQKLFVSQFISLPFDDAAADAYARIRAELSRDGQLIGPNDLLIASICVANDVTLVTHNVGEFGRVPGLKLEDWET